MTPLDTPSVVKTDVTTSNGTRAREAERPAPASPGTHAVLVGVDGSEASTAALDWAVAEARHSSRALRVLHALEIRGATASPMVVAPLAWDDPYWPLRDARERVVTSAPDLALTTEQTTETATQVLVRLSHEVDLLVVGTSRQSLVGAAVLGSTAAGVAAHAACPVVVVREPVATDAPARVVAGVDGSPVSAAVAEAAMDWAAGHGCRVTLVHVGGLDSPAGERVADDGVRADVRATRLRYLRALVEQRTAPARTAHPDLEVEVAVLDGEVVEALVEQSVEARMVVVASCGRGALAGLFLGSVSEQVLQKSHCPVLLVHLPDEE